MVLQGGANVGPFAGGGVAASLIVRARQGATRERQWQWLADRRARRGTNDVLAPRHTPIACRSKVTSTPHCPWSLEENRPINLRQIGVDMAARAPEGGRLFGPAAHQRHPRGRREERPPIVAASR
uniref:Uncharacterized protein n=1 Tax=Arundo donax TaxID=35708 RepID=A0A0A8Z0T5_ARUDO